MVQIQICMYGTVPTFCLQFPSLKLVHENYDEKNKTCDLYTCLKSAQCSQAVFFVFSSFFGLSSLKSRASSQVSHSHICSEG